MPKEEWITEVWIRLNDYDHPHGEWQETSDIPADLEWKPATDKRFQGWEWAEHRPSRLNFRRYKKESK